MFTRTTPGGVFRTTSPTEINTERNELATPMAPGLSASFGFLCPRVTKRIWNANWTMNLQNEDCEMSNRKMFPNSVIPIPASGVTARGLIASGSDARHRDEKMDVSFSLGVPPNLQKELQARVNKGETISAEELKTKYAADPAAAGALETWLKNEGFTITQVSPDRTTIYANASASQVEASLGVHMVRVTREGQTYTAASDVPSLPESIAGAVVHIGGLQPYRQARKHLRSRMR
ncbi:hypothetical protein LQG66_17750 [Bradyrhizobium ontarionense]|uniref:Peptidase S53 activation domain-containing protein n=1 Tax=Bradyrhizobium ontarionense TaxID=2898149 RepID=A0ABY3RNE7_9BRAD|nr:protease pro-enzyme activation domain-containing protein [Bradyrhizobium sp. A19]UFZ08024.1 hypothetical protein LQG66_17750 [Bradyrhizobium sp. A19]